MVDVAEEYIAAGYPAFDLSLIHILISKASRYDIKGRKYIGANLKYYFTDLGLRNVRLNFRQQEPTPCLLYTSNLRWNTTSLI